MRHLLIALFAHWNVFQDQKRKTWWISLGGKISRWGLKMTNTQLMRIIWKANTDSNTSFFFKDFMMFEEFVNDLFCRRVESLPRVFFSVLPDWVHPLPLFCRNPRPEVPVHKELCDSSLFQFFYFKIFFSIRVYIQYYIALISGTNSVISGGWFVSIWLSELCDIY